MGLVTQIPTTSLLIRFTDAMVVAMKNEYEEGTSEYLAFEAGISAERARLQKVLEKYHKTFCGGELSDHDCDKTMQIRYLYDFVVETRSLK